MLTAGKKLTHMMINKPNSPIIMTRSLKKCSYIVNEPSPNTQKLAAGHVINGGAVCDIPLCEITDCGYNNDDILCGNPKEHIATSNYTSKDKTPNNPLVEAVVEF